MPLDIRVRAGRAKDLPQLIRLWRELIGFDESLGGQDFRLAAGAPEQWERHLSSFLGKRTRVAQVADVGSRAVGFLLASLEQPPGIFMERKYGHISAVYVQEGYRGKGVGGGLLRFVGRHSQQLESPGAQLGLQTQHLGKFLAARGAPGGPEIEQHDLSLVGGHQFPESRFVDGGKRSGAKYGQAQPEDDRQFHFRWFSGHA